MGQTEVSFLKTQAEQQRRQAREARESVQGETQRPGPMWTLLTDHVALRAPSNPFEKGTAVNVSFYGPAPHFLLDLVSHLFKLLF